MMQMSGGHERPPMWLRLPPGYTKVDVLDDADRDRVVEQLTEGLSKAARRVVAQAIDTSQEQIRAQRKAHLTLSAVGMHPREGEDGGADLSTFTAGLVPAPKGPPSAMLLAVAQQEEQRDETTGVHVADFPAGPAVVTDRSLSVSATDFEDEPIEAGVNTIRVTWVAPSSGHLAVIELASNSADSWPYFRQIMLELIAPSVSFEDPVVAAQHREEAAALSARLNDRLGGNAPSGMNDNQ